MNDTGTTRSATRRPGIALLAGLGFGAVVAVTAYFLGYGTAQLGHHALVAAIPLGVVAGVGLGFRLYRWGGPQP
jgi:hypothetical protein